MPMPIRKFNTGKFRENHCSWKGGRYINDSGYVMIYNPDHPRSSLNGYVREHIILAENALGKPLPQSSQIHHFGKRHNNGKIVLCEDQEYHYLLHTRERSLSESGNPNFRKCKFCKKYDDPKNLHIVQSKPHGWNIHHQSCESEYEKKRTIKRALKRRLDRDNGSKGISN